MNDPQTPAEWQEAVDAAKAGLAVESAHAYGIVEGGPRFDVERCEEILARGAEQGISPSPLAIESLARELVGAA